MVFPPARCSARAAVDATLFGAAAVARNHESDVGEQPLGHGFCTMGSTFLFVYQMQFYIFYVSRILLPKIYSFLHIKFYIEVWFLSGGHWPRKQWWDLMVTSCVLTPKSKTYTGLVIWNMNFIFPYIGNNNPNWLRFFRGVETTNQLLIAYQLKMQMKSPNAANARHWFCLRGFLFRSRSVPRSVFGPAFPDWKLWFNGNLNGISPVNIVNDFFYIINGNIMFECHQTWLAGNTVGICRNIMGIYGNI